MVRTPLRLASLCAAIVFVMTLAAPASADLITVTGSGSVTRVPAHFRSLFRIGDPLDFTYSFDLSVTDAIPDDPNWGQYRLPTLVMTVNVAGYTIFADNLAVSVYDAWDSWVIGSQYPVGSGTMSSTLPAPHQVRFVAWNVSGPLAPNGANIPNGNITSEAFMAAPDPALDWDRSIFDIRTVAGGTSELLAQITSWSIEQAPPPPPPAPVPEPSSLLLLGSGIAGLVARNRRRRRERATSVTH